MNKRRHNPSSGESGQSTVEFGLTLMLLIAFTMFFLRLSLVFAFGNFTHYATFMAARAYLSAGETVDDQKTRGTDVLVNMLKRSSSEPNVDRFPMVAKGVGGSDVSGMEINGPQFEPGNVNLSWMQGVRYTFRSKLFVLPLGNMTGQASKLNQLELTSESWLGRDPAYSECKADLNKRGALFDNGC